MDLGRFLRFRPFVYHYTTKAGLERIKADGMWCTLDLLDRYELPASRIAELTTFPRNDFTVLEHPHFGPARLSHQRPMLTPSGQPWKNLLDSLAMTNTNLNDFCTMLASRVFLFPEAYDPAVPSRAATGFVNRVRAAGPLVEVAFSTRRLLVLCESQGLTFELSAHNAGSSPRKPLPKGRATWRSIPEFSKGISDIQEVVIEGSVARIGEAIDSVRLLGDPA